MDNAEKLEIANILLNQCDYISADKIARKLNLSEKTVRGRIKELNAELSHYGEQIIVKHGKGYYFSVSNEEKYYIWEKSLGVEIKRKIPTTVRERIQYILLSLLSNSDYIKRENLGDFFFVSEKTVSGDLKQVEHILEKYNLFIKKRPGYGMKVVGTEFAKRQCLMNHYLIHNGEWEILEEARDEKIKRIGEDVLHVIREERLSFTEISLKSLIDYIYVSERRIQHGFCIKDKIPIKISEKEYTVARNVIVELMRRGVGLINTNEEINYLTIYLGANKMFQENQGSVRNLVIEQYVDDLTDAILNSIFQNYQVDMRDNLNLRMSMNKHLLSMDVRLKYCIQTRNPLLSEVKEKYSFSFLMAQQAGNILAERYGKIISEDEISYFAMLFEMERLNKEQKIHRLNILLVCATGKVSAHFLMFSIQERFHNYIDHIELCSLYELEEKNMEEFDYIFSSVPIDIPVKIPIIFIHDIMTPNEIQFVEKEIAQQKMKIVKKIFRKKLFLQEVSASSKEDVLKQLCSFISKIETISEGFYESVLYREKMGSTDFGNLLAIPHPYRKQSETDIVCVAILKDTIIWDKNPVRLVILSSIGNSETEEIQFFYELVAKLMGRKDLINQIIKGKTYEVFCKSMRELLLGENDR